MFLGVSSTVFLKISNYLPHLALKNRSIQIAAITNFVVISNVGIRGLSSNLFYFIIIFFLSICIG